MTIEITNTTDIPGILKNAEKRQEIVGQVVTAFEKGKEARADKERTWLRCWKAYNMFVDRSIYRKQPWRSKLTVGWSYEAVESAVNELRELLLPSGTDFFGIQPVIAGHDTQQVNADVMDKYLKYTLKNAGFMSVFPLFLKQAAITGNSAMKVYWKTDTRTMTQRQVLPDGTVVTEQATVPVFDAPYVEVLDMQDFVLWPATGNLDKAMCVHRLFKSLDEIQGNPLYKNTADLEPEGVSPAADTNNTLKKAVNETFGIQDSFEETDNVELLEAWGDFCINGKKYRNYVVTVANRQQLIRFQPNPYDYGMKPFVFGTLRPVPGQIYGIGIIEPALNIQAMGSTITNMILDEAKLKIHGVYKYEPDGVFNPDEFTARPGGCFPVGNVQNLQAVNPNVHMNVGFSELSNLKSEFEQLTGVTQFSKGGHSLGSSRTAREAILLNQAGNKMFVSMAKHLNQAVLIQLIQLVYMLVRQFGNPLDISEYTGVPLTQLNLNIPLDKMNIQITGLQTTLLKQTNIENIERFVSGVAKTPGFSYVEWPNLIKKYYRNLGGEDVDDVLLPPQILEVLRNKQLMQILGMKPEQVNPSILGGAGSNTEGLSGNGLDGLDGPSLNVG
ncbi:MAG: hypothetical protein KTR14_08120 [Vampirovibrio sp.]|nr:hypothetical protein [Vampirovibrio sp.]